MEYIYAAMLLHKAGQAVNDAHMKKVLEAASVKVDETRIKATVAALDGVNIDEAIKNASFAAPAAAPAASGGHEHKAEHKKEEKKEEKVSEDVAAAGLGALFG